MLKPRFSLKTLQAIVACCAILFWLSFQIVPATLRFLEVRSLIKELNHSPEYAASRLGEIGPPARTAVPALVQALKQEIEGDLKAAEYDRRMRGSVDYDLRMLIPGPVESIASALVQIDASVAKAQVPFLKEALEALGDLDGEFYASDVRKGLNAIE